MQSPGKRKRRFSLSASHQHTRRRDHTMFQRANEEESTSSTVPLDEMLSSMFLEIRSMKPEMACFWACALDRRGLGESLWKYLVIFAFRSIGYAYPEAPCYVYTYFCSWLEEMKRYRRELRARLEYGCTRAILSLLSTREATFGKMQRTKGKGCRASSPLNGLDQPWVVGMIESGMGSLPSSVASSLMEDVVFYMKLMPSELMPTYEFPCGCDSLKQRLQKTHRLGAIGSSEMDLGLEFDHLNTARHLLINVVHYLCVLPKSTLSRDASFFTAFKCIGMLEEKDWIVTLSFPNLEQGLFSIRKDLQQPVQQACICLCAGIIHKDERRVMDMTDLFSVWNEEEVFWKTLFMMIQAFPVNYQWIANYLAEYHRAWAWSNDCTDYFKEGSRSAMFSAAFLFVRGPPHRDDGQAMSPNETAYSIDYVRWFYAEGSPSYESLAFVSSYEEDAPVEETQEHISNIISSCFPKININDDDDDDDDEHLPNEKMDILTKLVCRMVLEFPGQPSIGTEPQAVRRQNGGIRVSTLKTSKKDSTGFMAKRSQSSERVSTSRSHATKPLRKLGSRSVRQVFVPDQAVDWSTKRGRAMGRGVRHAFRVSEVSSRNSMISNPYFDDVEISLTRQFKRMEKARKERRRAALNPNTDKRRRTSETKSNSSSQTDDDNDDDDDDDFDALLSIPGVGAREEETHERLFVLKDKIDQLSLMPWYDPGFVTEYRTIASNIIQIRQTTNVDSNTSEIPSRFWLNIFDVQTMKEATHISFVGKDDWLQILYDHHHHHHHHHDDDDDNGVSSIEQEKQPKPDLVTPIASMEEEEDEMTEESSSELGGVYSGIQAIRLSSPSTSSDQSLSASVDDESGMEDALPVVKINDIETNWSTKDGIYAEDLFFWKPLQLETSSAPESGEMGAYLSVSANWNEDMVECGLMFGPFQSTKEAMRVQTAYEITTYLRQHNTPYQVLARWSESVRRAILLFSENKVLRDDKEGKDVESSSITDSSSTTSSGPSRIDILMSSMEKINHEYERAFVPTAILRQKERQSLIDTLSIRPGTYGDEDYRGILLDPLETISSCIVLGDKEVERYAWPGPYRCDQGILDTTEPMEPETRLYYLQYKAKLCTMPNECRYSIENYPLIGNRYQDTTSSLGTEFSIYLHQFYMGNQEDDGRDIEEVQTKALLHNWLPITYRYYSDVIDYERSEEIFFNTLFTLVFSRFSIHTHPIDPALVMNLVEKQICWFCEETKENISDMPDCLKADRFAREVFLTKYAIEDQIVVLEPEAFRFMPCIRTEFDIPKDGVGSTERIFLEDLLRCVSTFKNMKDEYDVVWSSIADCFVYFIEDEDGQRKTKERLTLWKDALSNWLYEVTDDMKSRMDQLADEEHTSSGQHVDQVMDYIVVETFVERLETLLLELFAIPTRHVVW